MFLSVERKKEIRELLRNMEPGSDIKDVYYYGFSDGFQDGVEYALPPLSEEEKQYRKGYSHGFALFMNQKIDDPKSMMNKILAWRHSKKRVGAPGTFLENKKFGVPENIEDVCKDIESQEFFQCVFENPEAEK